MGSLHASRRRQVGETASRMARNVLETVPVRDSATSWLPRMMRGAREVFCGRRDSFYYCGLFVCEVADR